MRLRSVELNLPDPAAAHRFLCGAWGARDGGATRDRHYVRGSAGDPYLVGLVDHHISELRSITFAATDHEIVAIAARAGAAQRSFVELASDDIGGGSGLAIELPGGAIFRFLANSGSVDPLSGADLPVKLTHVVLNATDAEEAGDFCEEVLGFRVSDRTRGMVFVRCNTAHHSVAFARAGFDSLNHIAFEMADLDAVMRGMGRMRDAGFTPAWGPGRHGPGDNVFAYYIATFGGVVEFSTAVETVAEDYRVGSPADWTWPPNRIDRWGISDKDFAALAIADRAFSHALLPIVEDVLP